ncbi:putative RNase H-like nuclease [Phycicoccus badiiscoriae]|uniref:Putative RNase H-like nuclease n=1 Tax=Pedococcus badiiscoriae TaxID=642776 RepID=A0A852WHE8_9MICO|nr:putative RNase H-like nuclease [Pedococcus badiiscoriae]
MGDLPNARDLSVELTQQVAALAARLEMDGGLEAHGGLEVTQRQALAEIASTVRRLGAALGVDVDDPAMRVAGSLTTSSGAPSPAPPVEVIVPVLGVDACAAGWVGAILDPNAPRPRIAVAASIGALVEAVRQTLDLQAVAIDIPIGLPDDSTRQADVLARKALKGKASTVFTTLTREAYEQETRAAADTANRARSGQGVGAQAFRLRDKVLEVDAWVRSRPTVAVFEAHPELSFAIMAGAPIRAAKRTDEGRAARLAALAAAGIASPSVLKGDGYAADDVLDACAAAWTAARRTTGLARSLPETPETFSDGIPAAIWV